MNGRIIDLPAPLAVVSSLCHLVDQTQVIYQPIVLVKLILSGKRLNLIGYPGAFILVRVTYSISARARVYTVVFKTTLPGIKCGTWLKPFIPLSFDLMFINPSLGGCNHLLYCRLCMIYSIIKHVFAGTKIFDLLRSCLLKHWKIFYIK